jgi:hypothetical protein
VPAVAFIGGRESPLRPLLASASSSPPLLRRLLSAGVLLLFASLLRWRARLLPKTIVKHVVVFVKALVRHLTSFQQWQVVVCRLKL